MGRVWALCTGRLLTPNYKADARPGRLGVYLILAAECGGVAPLGVTTLGKAASVYDESAKGCVQLAVTYLPTKGIETPTQNPAGTSGIAVSGPWVPITAHEESVREACPLQARSGPARFATTAKMGRRRTAELREETENTFDV